MSSKSLLLFVILLFCIMGSWAACHFDKSGKQVCDKYIQWNGDKTHRSISWAGNCSFAFKKHNNLKAVSSSTKDACGRLCLRERRCTHFTFTKAGACRMMSNRRQFASEPAKTAGFFCGFINTRTDFARVGK